MARGSRRIRQRAATSRNILILSPHFRRTRAITTFRLSVVAFLCDSHRPQSTDDSTRERRNVLVGSPPSIFRLSRSVRFLPIVITVLTTGVKLARQRSESRRAVNSVMIKWSHRRERFLLVAYDKSVGYDISLVVVNRQAVTTDEDHGKSAEWIRSFVGRTSRRRKWREVWIGPNYKGSKNVIEPGPLLDDGTGGVAIALGRQNYSRCNKTWYFWLIIFLQLKKKTINWIMCYLLCFVVGSAGCGRYRHTEL